MSTREQRLFMQNFKDGTRFWTSVDGMPGEFVIIRRPDALAVLRDRYDYCEAPWARCVLRERFVERVWEGREFFDDPYEGAPRRGKVWRLTDDPTPYPVLSWDPYADPVPAKEAT
jgi:hypothetical protein